jgi:hypothetical protein
VRARLLAAAGALAAATAATVPGAAAPAGAAAAGHVRPSTVRLGSLPIVPPGATRLGPLAASTLLHVDVVLAPRDPAALARFATDVSTPGNPLYRHYLPRGAFAGRFGPAPAAISAVESALRAGGLPAGSLAGDHLSVSLTATAGRLERAFATSIVAYRVGGRTAWTETAAPRVPVALAGVVQSVIGLDDLSPAQPLGLAAPSGRPTPRPQVVTGGPQPCAAATTEATKKGAYTADQLASAYRFSALYGAGDEGAGETVGIYEVEPELPSDIAMYLSCYGVRPSITYTNVDNGPGTGPGLGEAALDIEDVAGLAPKAAIHVFQGPNTVAGDYDTYARIFSADDTQVVTTSWGLCEEFQDPSTITAENSLFQEAAAQGQSVFASSGDAGSSGCQDGALEVDDPASQPFVTGVGGTTLRPAGPPPNETVWNNGKGSSGGGVSAQWSMPDYQSHAPPALHVVNTDSSGNPCSASANAYCREVPDVSADGDPQSGYVVYYDKAWAVYGGTSAATPLWASLVALVDAQAGCAGRPVGFANPALYAAAGSAAYHSDFDDVTRGSNDVTGGGLYAAGAGYDMASGLGTPDVAGLAPALCAAGTLPAQGYWLATAGGAVFPAGHAGGYGSASLPAGLRAVGLAATPDGRGYWVVTDGGEVYTFGDARYRGDLQQMPGGTPPVHVTDVVSIVGTSDDGGYWLLGADGQVYPFGDAAFRGDLLHIGGQPPLHVHDVVGMVASPSGGGYLLIGADGGVFAFGAVHFYGSLPGLGVKVDDIRGILPAPGDSGYVLVGADGGAFVFGHGAPYKGSLPGRGIRVSDIVGLALTPDGQGYWMAGAGGATYAFGAAAAYGTPPGTTSHLPVVAIAGT